MIVPAMTSKELLMEIARDYPMVMSKAMYLTENLRRLAVKSKEKHVHRVFDYKSKQKNDWLIIVDYYVKDPTFLVVVYYVDKYGINGIMVNGDQQTLTHYTPHFLERYNERFLHEPNISKVELLKRYLSKNSVAYMKYVPDTDDMKNRFFARSREGVGLGYIETISGILNTINHFKTFIANDMIFENQQANFTASSIGYKTYWNEMFKHTRLGAYD
jgi:hypothetical protein